MMKSRIPLNRFVFVEHRDHTISVSGMRKTAGKSQSQWTQEPIKMRHSQPSRAVTKMED
eukprot:CAMPEP_0194756510 /NCGR_PEP_ID=MMETSP0323_2-20130528/10194_1 /TAXON_ID=2866 ORGANISM="Crypthecodinium cohnii, Strain Seligo" /NCGR_SAMPLE_ID=MMETSP0323_2 /ASSEMBLY_ACC=CAM_ASM_000346 /LENGTH=58 /DNA_ID=CAMNT_0039676053 /DNA_START=451 /DNA_END=627 /DNA_ORIENTATION=-